jgi:hypothetical protein
LRCGSTSLLRRLLGFREVLGTEQYLHEERNYKVALHRAISALLAPEVLADSRFPAVLGALLGEDDPDLTPLGIEPADLQLLRESGVRSYRAALANLSGGRWGLAQFLWIPRAVEFELGNELHDAFEQLVDDGVPLAQRVDGFRDDLYVIQQRLQQQGGFLPKWRLLRVSLSFVAAVLGSYDRMRYTYYAYTPLRGASKTSASSGPRRAPRGAGTRRSATSSPA